MCSQKIDRFKADACTPELMLEYRKRMCKAFGNIQVNKPDSKYLDIISNIVALMSDVDADEFIDYYSQTIYRIIFFAKKFTEFDPWRQVKIVGHENHHGNDFREDPMAMSRYLVNPHERAMSEAGPLVVNYELDLWRWGKWPDLSNVKPFIKKYGCSDLDAKVVYSKIEANMMMCDQLHPEGKFLTREAEKAVEILTDLGLVNNP